MLLRSTLWVRQREEAPVNTACPPQAVPYCLMEMHPPSVADSLAVTLSVCQDFSGQRLPQFRA